MPYDTTTTPAGQTAELSALSVYEELPSYQLL